jgi:serine/threonine-protein kinase
LRTFLDLFIARIGPMIATKQLRPQRIISDPPSSVASEPPVVIATGTRQTIELGSAATRFGVKSTAGLVPGAGQARLAFQDGACTLLRPGMQLGHFRLLRRLGQGAQGDVWKARRQESRLDIVALKVLNPGLAKMHNRLAQFRREAERGTRLAGPSLLHVFESGEIDGFLYMAMPYVEGKSLQQVVRARRAFLRGEPVAMVHPLVAMDEEPYLQTAARIMMKAALALSRLHACRVVHRDIKPANILLDRNRVCGVYLCDLGLGRDLEFATSDQMRDGAGTPLYMAPERLLKAPADEILCDLYSMGVTLFETFTLGRPFDTPPSLPLACLPAHLARSTPKFPSDVKPGLPAELEGIILKAMARLPRDRHHSAQELASDLDQFLMKRRSLVPIPTHTLSPAIGRLAI